ncbi:MAG TPA: radical SAM protein [Bdellovibrio sp.]|nr:radical SAM protein [Bdellovibrio sp.]
MKKLILMFPNQKWQKDDENTRWFLNPSTLALLAAMVRDVVDVKIVDANFSNLSVEDFKQLLRDYRPDFVGISAMASEYADILDVAAKAVKEVNGEIIVIAGGVHVTIHHEYVMKNQDIDYAVKGEGEYVLKGLLEHLLGRADLPDTGIIYRHGGQVIVQPQAYVQDLTILPWPAYDLYDFKSYFNSVARFGPNRPPAIPSIRIVTVRGCPFKCSFCQVHMTTGRNVRTRDPQDVVAELAYVKEAYGIKSVIFEDDNLLSAKGGAYAKELLQLMIDRKLNLKWIATGLALFLLTDDILDLMVRSGCTGVNIAIESGNERVLKEIVHKPIKSLSEVPTMIEKVKSYGMHCIANFIIGFPGETWSEIRETISFAENCGADYIKLFFAVPLFGTELYRIATKSGALAAGDDELPVIDWRHSQLSSTEWTSKDLAILRAYEWDRINFKPEKIKKVSEIWGMTEEEINVMRKRTRDSICLQ